MVEDFNFWEFRLILWRIVRKEDAFLPILDKWEGDAVNTLNLKPHVDSGPAVLQELESQPSFAVVEDSDVFGHGQGGHDNGFVGLLGPFQAHVFQVCVIGGQVHHPHHARHFGL